MLLSLPLLLYKHIRWYCDRKGLQNTHNITSHDKESPTKSFCLCARTRQIYESHLQNRLWCSATQEWRYGAHADSSIPVGPLQLFGCIHTERDKNWLHNDITNKVTKEGRDLTLCRTESHQKSAPRLVNFKCFKRFKLTNIFVQQVLTLLVRLVAANPLGEHHSVAWSKAENIGRLGVVRCRSDACLSLSVWTKPQTLFH